MRAFTPTDTQTDIPSRLEQAFAHVFITYTPVGLHTNMHIHALSVCRCI